MKKALIFQEKKEQLPLTFKYIEIINIEKNISHGKEIVYYIPCKICNTDYNVRRVPNKCLTRLI